MAGGGGWGWTPGGACGTEVGGGSAESIINPIPAGQANRGHVSAVSPPHPHLSLIIPHSFLWPGSACSMEAFLTAVPWVRSPQCRGQVCMSIFDMGRAACLSESRKAAQDCSLQTREARSQSETGPRFSQSTNEANKGPTEEAEA